MGKTKPVKMVNAERKSKASRMDRIRSTTVKDAESKLTAIASTKMKPQMPRQVY